MIISHFLSETASFCICIEQTLRSAMLIWSQILNICIVNFYTQTGKVGLHQDKDESPESLRK
ncbi:hypothetical protein ACS0TY_006218 [Phlomoides rotata]